jgi:hypothetical protein
MGAVGRISDGELRAWLPEPSELVVAKMRSFMALHDPLFSCAGVHIRRTDNKVSIAHSPDDLFIGMIGKLLDKYVKVYIATDNRDTYMTIARKFPGRILSYIDWTSGGDRWPKPMSCRSMFLDDYVDLMLLASCDRVVGSFNSSFSTMAGLYNKEWRFEVCSS